MLAEICARIFSKSPATFQVVRWFPFATENLDDVSSDMNLIEGPVRYRKRKKWKLRWAVLRRVNPAADVLDLILYQDQVSARSRQKEKAFISLKAFAGLQLLNKLDKHYNVLVTITTNEVVHLSFECIEQRTEWVAHLQKQFGQEQSYQGIIPRHKQKIKSGEATLRFYKTFFTLTRKDNFKCLGKWNLVDLPHYGAVDGGFAFQVKDETTSHGLPSIYYFATRQGKEIHELFDSVCRGADVLLENTYVTPAGPPPQRSESQTEGVSSRPNFFKRTWLRISKRGPKRPRPRSRSVPSLSRRGRHHEEVTAPVPLTPELPSTTTSEVFKDETRFSRETAKSVKPSETSSEHPLTPDGYELMNDNPDEVFNENVYRVNSMTSQSSDKRLSLLLALEQGKKSPIDEESTDKDGYVLVDEMDVEEIVKEAERRLEEEKKRGDEAPKATLDQASVTNKDGKALVCSSEGTTQAGEEKKIIKSDEVAQDDTDGKPTLGKAKSKETLVNGVCAAGKHENGPIQNEEKKKEETPPARLPKTGKSNRQTKGKRGLKNPPPELSLPDGDVLKDAPYVNTPAATTTDYVNVTSPPKTADYINVPGSKLKVLRERSRTTPNKKKQHHYDMYDGNDDSIYHSVESLMPGNPAYQNLQHDANRSHSFDNIPGHAYSNLPGHNGSAGLAYQNISPPGAQAYVNINSTPKRKFQRNPNTHNLNYIHVEGTSGPPVMQSPVEPSGTGVKPSSDYTWIDESKTRLLKETARLHSDLRKENLPKVQTKKY
ncbi:uncharacterized protein LOC5521977 [Nematostella vectensis]|nr:uncharacterized protein LOC5521977 [Nematostella vectensis]